MELPPPIRSTVTSDIQDSARKVSKSLNAKRQSWSQVLRKKGEGRHRWHHFCGRLPKRAVSPPGSRGTAPPSPPGPQPPSCLPGFPPAASRVLCPPRGLLRAPTHPRLGPALRPHAPLQPRGVCKGRRKEAPRLPAALLQAYFPRWPGETSLLPLRDGQRGLLSREQDRVRRRRWAPLVPLN